MSRCAGCGETLQGRFVTALGRAWHPHCFRCRGCGGVIADGRFRQQRGEPYHPACHGERFGPVCAGCGKRIAGVAVTALERAWHPACLRCAHCGQPIGGQRFTTHDGQPCHIPCHHARSSPPCAVCGGPIRTRHYLTNLWGESFCATHQRELPPCQGCGRLICERLTGGGVRYGDGRAMCSRCVARAVTSVAEGAMALGEVAALMARHGLSLDPATLPLRLVDQGELSRLAGGGRGGSPPTGLALTRTLYRERQEVGREVPGLYILHGLPRDMFATVAAHELTHAWLFLNRFPRLASPVEEGLCCLMESLWLQSREGARAAYRLKLLESQEDPVYGRGYRAARRGLAGRTMAALLDHVRRSGRLPGSGPLGRLMDLLA